MERRTIRKLQLRLLPLLFVLYVVSFIDRINIGFAALTMNKDLAITSQQFGFAAGIFFFGYCVFEVPSNLLLHKLGARIWITRILLTWGVLAALTGLVQSVHQLYLVRFLLGLAEAGYFPGMVLYLTYWFRQKERAQAMAWFLTGLPVTSIVCAPLSGLILDHAHGLGLASWRWLLILEGLPAIVCGLFSYFLLPNCPSESKFLTPAEREWLCGELSREQAEILENHSYSVFQTMSDGRVWRLASIFFGLMIGLYTLSFWAPQLIKSLSSQYSNSTVGFVLVVPHLLGLVAMVPVSRSSDRHMERRYHGALPALVAGVALLLMGVSHSLLSIVALLSLLAIGVYSCVSPIWALPSEFLTGYSAAAGIGMINGIAALGGFVGPYVIGLMSAWSGGIYSGLALAGVPLVVSALLLVLLPKSKRSTPRALNTLPLMGSLE